MNKFYFIVLLSILVLGCAERELPTLEPMVPTCNLDVLVYQCSYFPCETENTLNLIGVIVELFATQEDAVDGVNILESVGTNNEGVARFISIDCGGVYVKVKSERNGNYISYQNLSISSTLNFHEVRFVGNNFYDNDDSAGLRQDHISLEYPTVGMTSTYRYFESVNQLSFDQEEYTDVFLRVKIARQIDEHSFIVEERLDEVFGGLGNPSVGASQTFVENLWTITDDEVYVSPLTGDYFTSYVWGLTEWFEDTEKQGYSFSLIRPEENEIDMSSSYIEVLNNFYGTTSISDYRIFGKEFSELIGDKVSYQSFDGPIKLRVYSLKDGPIRYINFWDGGAEVTKGFDLVLE